MNDMGLKVEDIINKVQNLYKEGPMRKDEMMTNEEITSPAWIAMKKLLLSDLKTYEKVNWGDFKLGFEQANAALEKAEGRIASLKDALEDMVNQFSYEGRPVKGVSSITAGGLSALEGAFDELGYSDPQPMPHKQCNWAGCTEHSTCGVPSSKGYKHVCGKHSDKMHEGDLSGLAQEALGETSI